MMILGFGACGRVIFQLLSEPGRTSRCLDDPARLTCILHEFFAALPLGRADAPVTRSLRHHRLTLDAIQTFFAYRKKLKASVHPRTLHRALWTGGRHAEDCVPTQSEETT